MRLGGEEDSKYSQILGLEASLVQVPLMDLKAEYVALKPQMIEAIDEALSSMQLVLGPNVQRLEQQWAELVGVEHAIGVGSGTDALIIALKALGIGPGDEVITVGWTFIATIEAIILVGAQPVVVDIEPDYYCLNSELLEEAITTRTRAIIPVHVFGHPADMAAINSIAEEHDLQVIEDCAQAHLARYGGDAVGSLGDCGIFSFYMSKNLSGYGEGGMITTSDDKLAEQIRLLRNHGYTSKYEHEIIGYNSRLDEIQAAILNVKLQRLEWGNQRRRELAAIYDEALADLPITTPAVAPQAEHVYHLYTIRTPDRESLAAHLQDHDISFATHYRTPAYLQPACRRYGLHLAELPVTEQAADEVLQLPIHPYLSEEQIEYVAETVRGFFA